MALLRIDFYSRYLKRNVMLTAVIPADKMDGENWPNAAAAHIARFTCCTACLAAT